MFVVNNRIISNNNLLIWKVLLCIIFNSNLFVVITSYETLLLNWQKKRSEFVNFQFFLELTSINQQHAIKESTHLFGFQ